METKTEGKVNLSSLWEVRLSLYVEGDKLYVEALPPFLVHLFDIKKSGYLIFEEETEEGPLMGSPQGAQGLTG